MRTCRTLGKCPKLFSQCLRETILLLEEEWRAKKECFWSVLRLDIWIWNFPMLYNKISSGWFIIETSTRKFMTGGELLKLLDFMYLGRISGLYWFYTFIMYNTVLTLKYINTPKLPIFIYALLTHCIKLERRKEITKLFNWLMTFYLGNSSKAPNIPKISFPIKLKLLGDTVSCLYTDWKDEFPLSLDLFWLNLDALCFPSRSPS